MATESKDASQSSGVSRQDSASPTDGTSPSKSPNFNQYAELYDSFYETKDYAAEASFVLSQLESGGSRVASLLELGIGTGGHAKFFLERGLKVAGVDRSARMIGLATDRLKGSVESGALTLKVTDLTEVSFVQKFDASVCLFHVMNYLPDQNAFEAGLRAARRHLESGRRFLFDAWNGPGVMKDPPQASSKEAVRGDTRIVRKTTPVLHTADRRVDVHFDFEITQAGDARERFQEVHPMRLIFPDEVERAAKATGFRVLHHRTWLKDQPASDENWYVYYLLEAI